MKSMFVFLFAVVASTSLSSLSSAQTSTQLSNAPEVVAAVAPVFPAIARAAHANGDVIVEVTVLADGSVAASKVISGAVLLQKGSEAAAKKWRFTPSQVQTRSIRLVFTYGYVDGKESDPEYVVTFMPPYKVEVGWNRPAPGY